MDEQHSVNIQEKPESKNAELEVPKKRSWGWIIGLGIGVVVVGLLFFFWNRNTKYEAPLSLHEHTTERNASETRFIDSIQNHTIINISDSVYGHTIIITDTLQMGRDTIFLRGNGIVVKADSSFKGPALKIVASNKLTEISNVTFENFATAILSENKNVTFKNVQFVNCPVPFQYINTGNNSFVLDGVISDTFTKKDTIPQRRSVRHE
jgi:hypothetical protein